MNIHTSHFSSDCRLAENVTGVILAGGKSSRFGKNKALEKIEGMTIIEKVCEILRPVFSHLLIVTNTPDEYSFLNIPMTGDLIKGLGPIGGVYSGLCAMTTEAGFFVACDMPFLNRKLICHMVDISPGYDAVVPKIDWMFEPLHALYTKQCIPAIKSTIDLRKRQIINCLNDIHVKYVSEQEIRAFDPEIRSFLNINRPDDIIRIQKEEHSDSGRPFKKDRLHREVI
ncbi:MAG TPA: molybdenum cofactor guanylyltransferase [Desulfobacteraceae bacterium]|nr:molybdenum cofactor guanylyltransferase [Desulfobacteraceae bacterium]HPJ66294.1 molybdenum cofactor guanylyltransferase [Desulfobacteraceae bacterium]HPQ29795.1 molybdenum cofactor guanylyltransferase [Desulfobacteraceae bacterium]